MAFRVPRRWLTIPECRDLLMLLASQLQGAGHKAEARAIRRIVRHMWRRPAIRVTSVKSKPMTPALKLQIGALYRRLPDASQAEIGNRIGVNAGRVSEAVAGKRR